MGPLSHVGTATQHPAGKEHSLSLAREEILGQLHGGSMPQTRKFHQDFTGSGQVIGSKNGSKNGDSDHRRAKSAGHAIPPMFTAWWKTRCVLVEKLAHFLAIFPMSNCG